MIPKAFWPPSGWHGPKLKDGGDGQEGRPQRPSYRLPPAFRSPLASRVRALSICLTPRSGRCLGSLVASESGRLARPCVRRNRHRVKLGCLGSRRGQDVPLFQGLLNDLFPGLDCPRVGHASLKAAIEEHQRKAHARASARSGPQRVGDYSSRRLACPSLELGLGASVGSGLEVLRGRGF